jgi:flagellar FliL protein
MRCRFASLLLCLLPLTSGTVFAAAGGKADVAGPYLAMEPFVVNVQDGARVRFMQVKVQVMSTNPQVLEALKLHTPALRDAMIMLLAHQNAAAIQSVEGRENLRAEALAAAAAVLTQVTGADPGANPAAGAGVEAVYFTDFIIQ